MSQSEHWKRWVWGLSAATVFIALLFLAPRRTHLAASSPTASLIEEAFWKLEIGEAVAPETLRQALAEATQVPDSQPRRYAQAVALLLLYGDTAIRITAPMVYIQRLLQMREDPVVEAYLGRLNWHIGRPDRAYSYLRGALAREPRCGTAYLFLARLAPDSACFWLKEGASATYSPAEATARQTLISALRCL